MEKIKENFKKYSTIYIVILLLLVIVGVSYAIFAVTNLSDENTISLGQISMSYTEPENALVLENALPMSDEDGKAQSNYFEFKVTTHATTDADDSNGLTVPYEIVIESLSRDEGMSYLSTFDIKVYLTKVVGGEEEEVTTPMTVSDIFTGGNIVNPSTTFYTTSDIHHNAGSEITTTYRLRAWIDESVDASKFSDATYQYKFRVNVNSHVTVVDNLDSNWVAYTTDEGLFYALYTLDTKTLPESRIYNSVTYTKTEEIDVSEQQNASVILGIYEDESGNKIGIIGQNGGVIAPENSAGLFSSLVSDIITTPDDPGSESGSTGGTATIVTNLEALDLTYLDTSRVIQMNGMFSSNPALKSIIFDEKFNTSNVTNMTSMFNMSHSLTELDLSGFDTSNVTSMVAMFYGTSDLQQVTVGCNWTTESASVTMMFDNSGVSEVTMVC